MLLSENFKQKSLIYSSIVFAITIDSIPAGLGIMKAMGEDIYTLVAEVIWVLFT